MAYMNYLLHMINTTQLDNPTDVKRSLNGLANEALRYYDIARCLVKVPWKEDCYPKTFDGSVNYHIADFVYKDNGEKVDTYLVCISVDDYPPTMEILEVDIDGNMIWENDWWEGEEKITLWYYITLYDLCEFVLWVLYRRHR